MAVAFVKDKKLAYYDSLGASGSFYLEGLKNYFRDEAERVGKPNWQTIMDDWETVEGSFDTPQQGNGSDCGVFSCTTANYISQDLELRFGQTNIENFRRRMTLEFLNLKLL